MAVSEWNLVKFKGKNCLLENSITGFYSKRRKSQKLVKSTDLIGPLEPTQVAVGMNNLRAGILLVLA